MPSELRSTIDSNVKDAMRARDKQRVGILRLVMSEFKKVEVDERIELDDTRVLAILDKMLKQRNDSLGQYRDAGRDDLADQEAFEIDVIREFLPQALSEAEIEEIVDAAIRDTGAGSMKDMGSLMGHLRPLVQGRADMAVISALVKARLG